MAGGSNSSDSTLGISSQQARFSGRSGKLRRYRELMVGQDQGLLRFFAFELYTLFIAPLPGLLGLGLRSIVLPFFLTTGSLKPTIGKSVTIRCPGKLRFGKGVILDDYAVVDYRDDPPSSRDTHLAQGVFLEDHVLIGRFSLVVSKGGAITLRRGCNVSSFCRIATQSHVDIGEGVLIGAYSYIGPGNHRTDDFSRPIIEQSMDIRGGVNIGRDCWIGAHTTILDGVTIGEGAVIGAHSFVRSDVPPFAVVAGTPAKIIRYRNKPESNSTTEVGHEIAEREANPPEENGF